MPNLLDWFSYWSLKNLARGVRLIETGPIELSGIAIVIVIFISIRIIAYCIRGLERTVIQRISAGFGFGFGLGGLFSFSFFTSASSNTGIRTVPVPAWWYTVRRRSDEPCVIQELLEALIIRPAN
jgi:hypothetical protein